MAPKSSRWRMVLVLAGALIIPSPVLAGPYFGEWGWFWHPGPDCPRGEYSPCHYWVPEWYELRACCRPSNLDQYPPGPTPPVTPTFLFTKSCCQTLPSLPSMPGAPYANPTAYFGTPITPQ
jgi:hypothetical protein